MMSQFVIDSIALLKEHGINLYEGITKCPKCKEEFKKAIVGKFIISFTCKNGHGWGLDFA